MTRLEKLLSVELEETLPTPEVLSESLAEHHPLDIAEVLSKLPPERVLYVLRALSDELAAKVLDEMPDEVRTHALEELTPDEAAKMVVEMAADERADAVQTLPPGVAEQILGRLQLTQPEIAEEVRDLAAYDEKTAGGLMTTEYVALPPEMKVRKAIEEVRRIGREQHVETITYIYVMAYGGLLLGVVSLRSLILSDPDQTLADIMTQNLVRVLPTADQEEVARYIAKYDLSAVPVVDSHGVILGVVTVDDVVDVVIEEATEDAQKMGAVSPIHDAYFATGFFTFIGKRVPWLVALFLGELLTTLVMRSYEAELAAMMDLVVFIPLIISSGGNSGSQSSSLIIRALAVGEVAPTDWARVCLRELGIGLALGLVLGIVGFVRASIALSQHQGFGVPLAVATSLVAIVTLGTLAGSLLPLLMRRLGLDPAVSSTPFIASLVDVVGLFAYFSLSRWILTLAI